VFGVAAALAAACAGAHAACDDDAQFLRLVLRPYAAESRPLRQDATFASARQALESARLANNMSASTSE